MSAPATMSRAMLSALDTETLTWMRGEICAELDSRERDADRPTRLTDPMALGTHPQAVAARAAANESDEYPPPCSSPGGHVWGYSDDDGAESATNRCLCVHCGADGDA